MILGESFHWSTAIQRSWQNVVVHKQTAVSCHGFFFDNILFSGSSVTSNQAATSTMDPSFRPLELSFPLPKASHTTLHAHLTFLTTSTMLFLTTTALGESSSSLATMGSFVYAIPDVGSAAFNFPFYAMSSHEGHANSVKSVHTHPTSLAHPYTHRVRASTTQLAWPKS